MSKMEDLSMRREVAESTFKDITEKFQKDIKDLASEREKLHLEFKRKLKQHVKGVRLNPVVTKDAFKIYIGEGKKETKTPFMRTPIFVYLDIFDPYEGLPCILEYRSSLWTFDEAILPKQIAETIKTIFIEYYGEL